MSYKPGDAAKVAVAIQGATGALANADSLPVGSVYHNGAIDGAVTVTVTNLATGRYLAAFTIPGGYNPGDTVWCFVAATVAGVATGDWYLHDVLADPATALDVAEITAAILAAATAKGTTFEQALDLIYAEVKGSWRWTETPPQHIKYDSAGDPEVTFDINDAVNPTLRTLA